MRKMKQDSSVDPGLREKFITHLRQLHPDIWRHWFDEIEIQQPDRGMLRVVVGESVRQRYLERSCLQAFTEAAQAATGQLLAVRFTVPDSAATTETDSAEIDFEDQVLLLPDYTFDSFVVGPSNRLAHASALAVAENPGNAYNPFFVHGGVGLGKTHLLQAICQELLRRRPSTRLVYISCGTFIDLFHDCLRAGRMQDFRHRFRGVDTLLIDDIHFLSKREQSQEEFFHTFNTLFQMGKQIVLSSDARPGDIPDLEERLVSRFGSGLVQHLDRPDFETRVSILKTKSRLRSIDLPDEVAAFIAGRFRANIRELEGALANIRSLTSLGGSEITLDLVRAAFAGDAGSPARSTRPTLQQIVQEVSQHFDVRIPDLLGKRRHKSIARPRQVCMWLARKYTQHSLQEIGGFIGGRDHTTVLHAIRTIDSKRVSDSRLRESLAGIQRGQTFPPDDHTD